MNYQMDFAKICHTDAFIEFLNVKAQSRCNIAVPRFLALYLVRIHHFQVGQKSVAGTIEGVVTIVNHNYE